MKTINESELFAEWTRKAAENAGEDFDPTEPAVPDEAELRAAWEQEQRAAWVHRMKAAGIPPRYLAAHLATNCAPYAEMEDKRTAYERSQEFAETGRITQRDRERFCLLYGGAYGTGKTWLATATFKDLLFARFKGGWWRKFYHFVREVQATYNPQSEDTADAVIQRFQRAPVLLLDDVGDLSKGDETEDRRRLLYEVLDYRNDYLLPTIITTNLTSDELKDQFGARTWERISEMAALVGMHGRNLRAEPLPESDALLRRIK